jgi:hypothetical protein
MEYENSYSIHKGSLMNSVTIKLNPDLPTYTHFLLFKINFNIVLHRYPKCTLFVSPRFLLLKVSFNIVLPFKPRFLKWALSIFFYDRELFCIYFPIYNVFPPNLPFLLQSPELYWELGHILSTDGPSSYSCGNVFTFAFICFNNAVNSSDYAISF